MAARQDSFFVLSIFACSTSLLIAIRTFTFLEFPLFEEIIFAALLSTTVFLIIMIRGTNLTQVNNSLRSVVHVCLIGFLSTVVILSNTVLNIDRSRSFYVLSWIDLNQVVENGGKLELNVNSTEASDVSGVQMRIDEQVNRGLISRTNGRLELTALGKFLVVISRFTAKIFSLNNWDRNSS